MIKLQCDWVYFATRACADWTITREAIEGTGAIIRTVYNNLGIRIANAGRLEPGHTILLAHGGDGTPYRPRFWCTVIASADPVQRGKHLFRAFRFIDEPWQTKLDAGGYPRDPVLKRFTGICIANVQSVEHARATIPRPIGNNTLRQWLEVFGPDGHLLYEPHAEQHHA